MWFFVVFILTASYTASLSSMLTVKQLEPDIDIEWLKRTDQKVGCGDSFMRRYLETVLDFKPENIIDVVPDEHHYLERFREGNITAAFLEVPYKKVFLNKHCKDYTTTTQTYRFGGLAFVSINYIPLHFLSSKTFFFLTGVLFDISGIRHYYYSYRIDVRCESHTCGPYTVGVHDTTDALYLSFCLCLNS